MQDTTEEMRKKQIEIIMSKTDAERTKMGADMIDIVYEIVKKSILKENPYLNQRELMAELFERYYSVDFSTEKIQIIKEKIRNFNT